MTNEEILDQAIEKAYKNGYLGWDYALIPHQQPTLNTFYAIIFDHEFAKAFWGDDPLMDINTQTSDDDANGIIYFDSVIPYWKHCLLEMVLAEEPLIYLEQYL